MIKQEDYIGKKFGKLTIVSFLGIQRNSQNKTFSTFLGKCECGNTKIVKASNLNYGNIKSCGCLKPKIDYNHFKIKKIYTKHYGTKKEKSIDYDRP